MGDRLTLETADERKAWLDIMAETCSTREADAAIRAYRERLPKVSTPLGDLEPGVAAGIGDAMGELIDAVAAVEGMRGIPRDYTVPREQLERLLEFILTPDGGQEAYCLDPVGTVGSVDAAILVVERLRGRTRSPASPEPRATPAAYVASAVHNEKRAKAAEAKLGTLIGAVDAALVASLARATDFDAITQLRMDWRAAVNAARGDAPTACECGPGARFDEAAQVCRECGLPLHDAAAATPSPTTQAPQVPDSPGRWLWGLHGDAAVDVFEVEGILCARLNGDTKRVSSMNPLRWGGRCTRGAPDVDVEALRRLADSLDGPGTHSDAHAIRTALGDA